MANKTLKNFCYKIYVTNFLVQCPFMWQESTLLSLWCQGQLNSNLQNQTNPRSMRVTCIHHWWYAYFFWRFSSSSSSISIFHLNDNSTIVICYAWMRDLEISRHFSKGWETSSNTTNFCRNTGLTALCKNGSIPSHGLSLRFSTAACNQTYKEVGTVKNLKSQKLPALKWQICEMTVLSECLTRFNSLTCELQHCRHWKKKHKCLCHKHGILHLDIQEGILQWILDWLSSPPWHRNQSGVHLWVQNLGKVTLNAFMAEWSCHETVSNWVTGMPPPKPSYQWVWDSRHPCLLYLQHNT